MPIIKFKRLDPTAKPPEFSTTHAAGADIRAIFGGVVAPRGSAVFNTGLAFEIPPGFAMKILSRSGHGFKNGIRLCNSVGLIDADYRGEVKVRLHNDSDVPYAVEDGERIAQAVIINVPDTHYVEADALSNTERGIGGFGSTGVS